MNNETYSHAVAFLKLAGSWNIHCTPWCDTYTYTLHRWWWLIIYSLLSSVSQSGPRQEVQIRQIAISTSWKRPETWLVAIIVKVCTQGLYCCVCCLYETRFAIKLKGQNGNSHKSHCPFESSHYHLCVTSLHSALLNKGGTLSVLVMVDLVFTGSLLWVYLSLLFRFFVPGSETGPTETTALCFPPLVS